MAIWVNSGLYCFGDFFVVERTEANQGRCVYDHTHGLCGFGNNGRNILIGF